MNHVSAFSDFSDLIKKKGAVDSPTLAAHHVQFPRYSMSVPNLLLREDQAGGPGKARPEALARPGRQQRDYTFWQVRQLLIQKLVFRLCCVASTLSDAHRLV